MKYPAIVCDLEKLTHNFNTLESILTPKDVQMTVITKVVCADKKIVETLYDAGCRSFGDSRIENLKNIPYEDVRKILVRLPDYSNVRDIVMHSDLSLNSSLSMIRVLNQEACEQRKFHDIIFMVDLGDLREGMWYKYETEICNTMKEAFNMQNISIRGLGTNLTCYGGVLPTSERLTILSDLKEKIKDKFGYDIPIISAGNSSSLPLVQSDEWKDEWNHLRIGEALYFGRDTAYRNQIEGMYEDVFTMKAQVIECYFKPSVPVGEIGTNAFGEVPEFIDHGDSFRVILNIGRQDVLESQIVPVDKSFKIIGASSDHLILSSEEPIKVGQVIDFEVDYGGLLNLYTSPYVSKEYNYKK
jgi:predicted amino acid racemase